MTDAGTVRKYLEYAGVLAAQAGQIALRYFRTPMEVNNKLEGIAFDPVTRADLEIESFLRHGLLQRFPSHGVLGEEHGNRHGRCDYRWVIDPIDGTRAFVTGSPMWGILIGLQEASQNLAGLMHQPYLSETFFGCPSGAWLASNGACRPLVSRRHVSLEQARLYCTDPTLFKTSEGALSAFHRLAQTVRITRFGGDCYAYCLLAMGHIDLVVEGSVQPYDIIPLIPIVESAGGVVTNWQGHDASAGGLIVAAANENLHREASRVLNANSLTNGDSHVGEPR